MRISTHAKNKTPNRESEKEMEFKKAACPHPTANTEIKLSFNKLPLKILICRVLCFAIEKRIVCLSVQISSVHFLSKSVCYQNDT